MALRQCEKCTEMVDEAKAFCPGCGHAFVEEEKRTQRSDFEAMDSTVQLGQTMYNQMLSDLGLNLGKTADKPEKRVEVLAPEPSAPTQPNQPAPRPVSPAAPAPAPVGKPPGGSSNTIKWLIVAGVFLVVAFAVLAIAVGLLIWMWPRISN